MWNVIDLHRNELETNDAMVTLVISHYTKRQLQPIQTLLSILIRSIVIIFVWKKIEVCVFVVLLDLCL